MKFFSTTAFLALFCCTVVVAQNALPQEVINALAKIKGVTRNPAVKVTGGFDDVIQDDVKFSDIDFGKSDLDPLAFALATFDVPIDAKDVDQATVTKLKKSLDVYITYEADVRRKGDKVLLQQLKVPKFFLSFTLARIQQAKGQKVTFPGGVEHQRGKVQKNTGNQSTQASLDKLAALL